MSQFVANLDNPDDRKLANRDQKVRDDKYASMATPTMAQRLIKQLAEDSSDFAGEKFTSSQWGQGTTEFVAKHYNTAQLKRAKENGYGDDLLTGKKNTKSGAK